MVVLIDLSALELLQEGGHYRLLVTHTEYLLPDQVLQSLHHLIVSPFGFD